MKVLSPMSGFPTWGSSNGRRIRESDLKASRTLTGLGKTETALLEGTHKVVCVSGHRGKER